MSITRSKTCPVCDQLNRYHELNDYDQKYFVSYPTGACSLGYALLCHYLDDYMNWALVYGMWTTQSINYELQK